MFAEDVTDGSESGSAEVMESGAVSAESADSTSVVTEATDAADNNAGATESSEATDSSVNGTAAASEAAAADGASGVTDADSAAIEDTEDEEGDITGFEDGELSEGLPADAFDDINIATEDELLEKYVKAQAADTSQRRMEKSSRGWILTGNNLIYYNQVKTLAKSVAAGDKRETYATFPCKDMLTKTTFTASELGLKKVAEVKNGKLTMTDTARSKLREKLKAQLGPENWTAVMTAALLDLPYELYWYNRYNTSKCTYEIKWNAEFTTKSVTVSTDPALTYVIICLPLINEYRVKGNASYYMADTDKTGAASTAVDTAKAIVSKYSDSSDYDKLKNYIEEVCELTDYDYAAARKADDPTYEAYDIYDSPWQLISVFDDDPQTKVVCAGYAKAFKFLCDLSTFRSDWIECQTIYGDIENRTTGSDPGAHLWCTVRMNNGLNYIVDPTWYDGSGGYYTFLQGGPGGSNYCDVTTYQKRDSSSTSVFRYTWNKTMKGMFSEDELKIDTDDYDPVTESDNDEPIPLTEARISGTTSMTYTGAAVTGQHPAVQVDGRTLTEGVDFIVSSYSNNVNVGKASFVITGIGQYTGSKTATFNIIPKGTSLKSLSKGKKRFTVRWNKQSSKMKKSRINGYQIQYSTSSTFASGNKTVTVSGYKKVSRTIKSLKAKKYYYVRIRTYLKTGGVTYYSEWSPSRSVKTK